MSNSNYKELLVQDHTSPRSAPRSRALLTLLIMAAAVAAGVGLAALIKHVGAPIQAEKMQARAIKIANNPNASSYVLVLTGFDMRMLKVDNYTTLVACQHAGEQASELLGVKFACLDQD